MNKSLNAYIHGAVRAAAVTVRTSGRLARCSCVSGVSLGSSAVGVGGKKEIDNCSKKEQGDGRGSFHQLLVLVVTTKTYEKLFVLDFTFLSLLTQ